MRILPHLFLSFFLAVFFALPSFAHTVKLSGASGVNAYHDFAAIAYWTLSEDHRDSLLTSIENTLSSGYTTNEFKAGFNSTFSDITSYNINAYYRSEPSNIRVVGLEPGTTLSYDGLLLNDLNTSFSLGLEFSRSSTDLQLTPLRKIKESFTSLGLSLSMGQEILENLRIDVGASFFRYSDPVNSIPGQRARRLVNISSVGSTLSSSGYPEKNVSFGVSWDWLESWSSSYNVSRTVSHFENTTIIYSSLDVGHRFSAEWYSEIGYTWSSAGSSTGSLSATYRW